MCNDLPSPSDWAVGSLAVGPKTKTIPKREVISGLILILHAANNKTSLNVWNFNVIMDSSFSLCTV
jgi:hypothetical protein